MALSAALEIRRLRGGSKEGGELGGVVAVGGVLPLSAIGGYGAGGKSGSPVLITGGQGAESAIKDAGVRRTKEEFQYVEVVRWAGRGGDGMPQNRDEMLPIMQFFARRLRSRSGVPEGSVEIGR